jgi:hypothetical protein
VIGGWRTTVCLIMHAYDTNQTQKIIVLISVNKTTSEPGPGLGYSILFYDIFLYTWLALAPPYQSRLCGLHYSPRSDVQRMNLVPFGSQNVT